MRSRPNDVKKKVMLIRLMIITSLDEDKVGLSIAKSVASGETRGAPAKGKREKDEKKKKKQRTNKISGPMLTVPTTVSPYSRACDLIARYIRV